MANHVRVVNEDSLPCKYLHTHLLVNGSPLSVNVPNERIGSDDDVLFENNESIPTRRRDNKPLKQNDVGA